MPALLEQLHANGVRPLRQVRPVPDVWLDRQRNRTEKEAMMVHCNGDNHLATRVGVAAARFHACPRCSEMKRSWCPRKRVCGACCWLTRQEAS